MPTAAFAARSRPTLDDLVREPELRDCAISPSGEHIVVLRRGQVEGEWKNLISIHAFDDLNNPRRAILNYDAVFVDWASDDTMFLLRPGFLMMGPGFFFAQPPGLAFLGRESDGFWEYTDSKVYREGGHELGSIIDIVPDRPDVVLAHFTDRRTGVGTAQYLNIKDGTLELAETGGPETGAWLAQDGRPIMRMDYSGNVMSLWRRDGSREWELVRKVYRSQFQADDFMVLGADTEPGVMMVAARAEGDDKRGLHRFDLKTMDWAGTVARRDDVDITGCFTDKFNRYVAASYVQDHLGYVFADPGLSTDHAKLADFFGGRNVKLYDISADMNRVIFEVSGPTEPGHFVVYDRQRSAVGYLGDKYPQLQGAEFAPTKALDVQVSDGLKIRAYLTTPVGEGPFPLVVMPHGGPEIRDALVYDPIVQALAAQGWMVLQPNFRGSDGYGKAFVDGGRRQWGGRVMLDIEESLDFVLAREPADPTRVAIFGSSFGGYAALMAGVRRPAQYRAIVSFAGMTDLIRMLRYDRANRAEPAAFEYWTELIGELGRDDRAIRDISPANQARSYEAPVMLIHGAYDSNVPVEQAHLMRRALQNARKSVEYIELPEQGHDFGTSDALRNVLEPTIRFIARAFGAT